MAERGPPLASDQPGRQPTGFWPIMHCQRIGASASQPRPVICDIKLGYIFGDIQILVIYVIQIQILICGYQGYWYIVIESEYILF